MDQEQVAPQLPTDTQKHPLSFSARRGPFATLLVANSLLTLITLGIYRFWAKTKVRRFFWRNVSFLNDPLEYTGTGGELFVGFLIVIAVLFPMGLIYSAIGAIVPPDHVELEIALQVIYYMALFALLQIGFYRMWRYRMSRTAWRGVRFGLDGSTWTYLKLATGWTVLTVLTLGITYPWMQLDLWRYQVRHTRLGDHRFHFEGNARSLIAAWLPVAVIGIVNIACFAAAFYYMRSLDGASAHELFEEKQNYIVGVGVILFAINLVSTFAFFYYRIRQARVQISGLRFADAQFHSGLPYWRLLGFAALGIFTILIAAAIAAAAFVPGMAGEPGVATTEIAAAGFGFFVITFLIFFLLAPFIWSLVFRFELIKQLVATTSISNPEALEQAAQTESEGPRTGEGLADALDIGGF